MRAKNLFFDQDDKLSAFLSYDISSYETETFGGDIENYYNGRSIEYLFELDSSQRKLIQKYIGIYGNSTVSIGRILSKVYTKKLFRHAIRANDSNFPLEIVNSENAYKLAGLQN